MIFRKTIICVALFLSISYAGSAEKSAKKIKPNVLFIIVDDLKPLLGCYDVKEVISPNIDRLAERGVVFGNAHCAQAICGPSRASILTGMRPDNNRTWFMNYNSDYKFFRDLNPGVITLPYYLKKMVISVLGLGKFLIPET